MYIELSWQQREKTAQKLGKSEKSEEIEGKKCMQLQIKKRQK